MALCPCISVDEIFEIEVLPDQSEWFQRSVLKHAPPKFKSAIELYRKFTFAAKTDYCMVRVDVYVNKVILDVLTPGTQHEYIKMKWVNGKYAPWIWSFAERVVNADNNRG